MGNDTVSSDYLFPGSFFYSFLYGRHSFSFLFSNKKRSTNSGSKIPQSRKVAEGPGRFPGRLPGRTSRQPGAKRVKANPHIYIYESDPYFGKGVFNKVRGGREMLKNMKMVSENYENNTKNIQII